MFHRECSRGNNVLQEAHLVCLFQHGLLEAKHFWQLELNPYDLPEMLADGVILCRLAEAVKPGTLSLLCLLLSSGDRRVVVCMDRL